MKLTKTTGVEVIELTGGRTRAIIQSGQTGTDGTSAMIDCYVSSKNPDTVNSTSRTLHLCANSASGTRYAFLSCPQLPEIEPGYTVTKALLVTTLHDAAADPHYLDIREVLDAWDENAITYANMPAVGECVLDYVKVDPEMSAGGKCEFDITNLVRKWYTQPETNHGVRIGSMTDAVGYVELCSFNNSTTRYRPMIKIDYISNAGLSTAAQYDTHSCGRAGEASANLFNGNLTISRALTAVGGSRMPVSVTAYYGSCLSDAENAITPMGKGWSLSCAEYVSKKTVDSKEYYIQNLGDGSQRWFKADGSSTSRFKDMDGLSLTLKVNSDGVTVSDKQDNKYVYEPCSAGGKLIKMTDALGTQVAFTYKDGLLTELTDGSGRKTMLTYTDGRLSAVSAPGYAADGDVTIGYSGDLLTSITDRDGAGATYEYVQSDGYSLLSRATHGQQSLSFGYDAHPSRRVVSCAHTGGANAREGRACAYEYVGSMTRVKDATTGGKGKSISYYFNDSGNVISAQDELGHAQFANFPSANLPNHPSDISALRRTIVNLFLNHSFEVSSDNSWSFSLEDGAVGTSAYSTEEKYMGKRSVRISRDSTTGRQSWYTSLRLDGPAHYTASAYVKGEPGMSCNIRANDDRNNYTHGEYIALDGTWQRVSVSFESVDALPHWFSILLTGGTGVAYIDCVQLEQDAVPNQYSLLQNGSFSRGTEGWTEYENNDPATDKVITDAAPGYDEGVPIPPAQHPRTYLQLAGSPDKTAGAYQEIPVSGEKGDVYVLGGWSRGKSKPIKDEERRYCMRLSFYISGEWQNACDIKWNEEWSDWQYASGVCIAPASYSKVRFDVSYQRNVNTACFTNFALYKEQFGTSYAYDSYGNILSASDMTGAKSYATYDEFHNMTSYRQPGRSSSDKFTMYWGTNDTERKKHLLNNIKTPEGVVNAYLYDEHGNKTLSRTRDADRTIMMQTTAEYGEAEGFNYLTRQTDARGNSTVYEHEPSDGTLKSATMPNGQQIRYQHDAMKRLTSVETEVNGNVYRNEYTYDPSDDRLCSVRHNTTGAATDVEYTFAVNELGDPTEVKVGNQLLSRNVYSPDAERRLECVEFGNGGKISYTYDDFDRVTGIKYDDLDADVSCRYGFLYGANGEISQIGDNNLRTTLYYERDMSERIARIKQTTNTASPGYDVHLTYDDFNNVSKRTERIGAIDSGATLLAYTAEYKYDKDNRPTEIKYDSSNARITHSYDALGRAHQRKVYGSSASTACLSTTYEYLDGAPISGVSAKSTTPLVSAIMQDGMSFEYTYDAKTSNLTSVRYIAGNTPTDADKYTYYVYDALGQLVRVNDQTDTTAGADGTTWVYEYDFGGNILRKKRYPYQTGELAGTPETIEYEYTDANWKDKVTGIGGKTIDYDAIGNVINDGEWTYSWQAGRQLKSMSKVGTDIVYDYDHNGIRIRKSVTDASGTVRTEYVVNDKRILHMVHGGENLHFYYDGTGRVSMVSFKGEKYAYVHNLQGDVVGLLDAAGNVVVEYSYDAWGKPLAVTGGMADTIGKLNPFRYRGYVWDEETGLYYLRSRYYRPEWGRFLNADDATILQSTNTDLNNRNIFAYCDNRPTIAADMDGEIWGISVFVGIAVGALVESATSAVCQITANLMEGKNAFDDVGSAMVTGLIDGALTMCPMGKKLYAVASAGLAAVEYIVQSMKKPEEGFNLIEMLGDMFIAGGMALVGGGNAARKYTKTFDTLDERFYKRLRKGWNTRDYEEMKKAGTYYWKSVRNQFPNAIIFPMLEDGIKALPSAVFIDTAIRGVKATIFT